MERDDEAQKGRCAVCGSVGTFYRGHRPIREGFACERCRATLRYRHQAQTLLALYGRDTPVRSLEGLAAEPSFAALHIYEPGIIGPFRAYLRELPRYTQSYYWPEVPLGELRDGVRCEDLEALTFPDESFDLVISSDIFEHVRDPWAGFAEVLRVLRPGGRHVFTVPVSNPLPARSRSRAGLPPVYHGSPTDPAGSLVHTDFGADLLTRLEDLGSTTTMHFGWHYNVTFVSERR